MDIKVHFIGTKYCEFWQMQYHVPQLSFHIELFNNTLKV